MSRRGWVLFSAMAVLWGIPYLLIAIAVETYAPAAVVAGRTVLGAALLLPIAWKHGALRPALARWPWVLAFAGIEMAGPFMLLSTAEQTLPSGITGLLVATVPLFATVVAFASGEAAALARIRVVGLLIGLGGVALIVSGSNGDGEVRPVTVAMVLLVAVCYATAPFIVSRRLDGVPGIGVAALSLAAVGVLYLPIGLVTQDGTPSARSTWALVGLAVVCTAVAFVVFFRLIAEVGPSKATMFTYVNPVVAIALGVVILDESLTIGLIVGFPVVLIGCWLAASHRAPSEPIPIAEP